jgi:hypothetical protein
MFCDDFELQLLKNPGIAAAIFVVWCADVARKISPWRSATLRLD